MWNSLATKFVNKNSKKRNHSSVVSICCLVSLVVVVLWCVNGIIRVLVLEGYWGEGRIESGPATF